MDLFISYDPEADQCFVRQLSEQLRLTRFKPLSVNLKDRYAEAIMREAESFPFNHDGVLVAISPAYYKSRWHVSELAALVSHENHRGRNGTIVPVLIEDADVPPILDGCCPPVANFARLGFEAAFKRLVRHLNKVLKPSKQVFVVMKLGDATLDKAYTEAMKPAIEDAGFTAYRITEMRGSGFVPLEILRQLRNSRVVLADLTDGRPNCYYETGYAHGLRKDVILSLYKPQAPDSATASRIHFDLAGNQCIFWKDIADLRERLTTELLALSAFARQGASPSSNPPGHVVQQPLSGLQGKNPDQRKDIRGANRQKQQND